MSSYFESEEFKELLSKYEQAVHNGLSCYLDVEDIMDLSDYYLSADDPMAAIDVAELGLEMHRDNKSLLSIKAGVLIYLHRFTEAAAIVDGLNPEDDIDVYYLNGQLEYALHNNVEKADEYFNSWLELVEKDVRRNMDKKDREEEMRNSYVHIIMSYIELAPELPFIEGVAKWIDLYVERFAPLGEYNPDLMIADIARDESLLPQVETVYTQLLDHNPYLETGWTVLAAAQLMMGKHDDAINSADFALAINPDDLDALSTKGQAFFAKDNFEAAEPLLRQYIDTTGEPNLMPFLASCLIERNATQEAIPYIDTASKWIDETYERDMDYAMLCSDIAKSYFYCDCIDQADIYIDKALDINPDDITFKTIKLELLYYRKDIDAAYPLLVDLLEHVGNKNAFLLYVSLKLISFGLSEHAIDIMLQVRETCDDSLLRLTDPYIALAYFYLHEYQKARPYLKDACIYHPEIIATVFREYIPEGLDAADFYEFVFKDN